MISKKDMIILRHLRENARMKLTEISEKTGIPVSTVHDRIKVHEKKSIQKHTSLIDFSKLGFNAKASIAIKVERNSKESLQNFLVQHSSTNTLYKVNHDFDFLGEFIFRNLNEAYDFVDSIEKNFNAKTQLMNVIDEIKKEEFLDKDSHPI
jgi:DNA-binding Lrp family transcriptional regulator